MKTWNEPSRGRKQCASCKMYVGVRTKICTCGYNFTKPKVASLSTDKAESDELTSSHKFNISLVIPCGKSPIDLEVFERPEIYSWTRSLSFHYGRQNLFMESTVPKYFLRQYLDIFSVEYSRSCGYIDELYADKEIVNE